MSRNLKGMSDRDGVCVVEKERLIVICELVLGQVSRRSMGLRLIQGR